MTALPRRPIFSPSVLNDAAAIKKIIDTAKEAAKIQRVLARGAANEMTARSNAAVIVVELRASDRSEKEDDALEADAIDKAVLEITALTEETLRAHRDDLVALNALVDAARIELDDAAAAAKKKAKEQKKLEEERKRVKLAIEKYEKYMAMLEFTDADVLIMVRVQHVAEQYLRAFAKDVLLTAAVTHVCCFVQSHKVLVGSTVYPSCCTQMWGWKWAPGVDILATNIETHGTPAQREWPCRSIFAACLADRPCFSCFQRRNCFQAFVSTSKRTRIHKAWARTGSASFCVSLPGHATILCRIALPTKNTRFENSRACIGLRVALRCRQVPFQTNDSVVVLKDRVIVSAKTAFLSLSFLRFHGVEFFVSLPFVR